MLFEKIFTFFSLLAVATAISCLAGPVNKCSISMSFNCLRNENILKTNNSSPVVSVPKTSAGLDHGTAAVYDQSCKPLSREVPVSQNDEHNRFKAGKAEVDIKFGGDTFNATVHPSSGDKKTVTEFYCTMDSVERDCRAYVACGLFAQKKKFRA